MMRKNLMLCFRLPIAALLLFNVSTSLADKALTTSDVMDSLRDSDWRRPDPGNLLFMRLPGGEVIFELAPGFAPKTVANIRTLVNEKYYDGLAIVRSHDNYVAQWGDPAEEEEQLRPLGSAAATIPPEFDQPARNLDLIRVDSRDAYADVVGFGDGFPAASDGERTWLIHCYGTLAVARGMEPNSGNGSSLYVVIGHAPRHLDRNLTVVGRVLSGIETLSSLPRGTGPLGFYESVEEQVPIASLRSGNNVPAAERPDIDVLRTDTESFQTYVRSRAYRYEDFWVHPTGRVGICNINPPVRITSP